MEGLGFLLDEFFSNSCLVWVHGFVVVVFYALANIGCCTTELAREGSALGVDAERLVKFDAWIAGWWVFIFDAFHGVVDCLEITMRVCVFPAEVAYHIAMIEVEGDFKHAVTKAPLA